MKFMNESSLQNICTGTPLITFSTRHFSSNLSSAARTSREARTFPRPARINMRARQHCPEKYSTRLGANNSRDSSLFQRCISQALSRARACSFLPSCARGEFACIYIREATTYRNGFLPSAPGASLPSAIQLSRLLHFGI